MKGAQDSIPLRMRLASKKERYVPHEGRLLFMERRGRRGLAEDAERWGRVSSTPLRGYDTTPRRQVSVKTPLLILRSLCYQPS